MHTINSKAIQEAQAPIQCATCKVEQVAVMAYIQRQPQTGVLFLKLFVKCCNKSKFLFSSHTDSVDWLALWVLV